MSRRQSFYDGLQLSKDAHSFNKVTDTCILTPSRVATGIAIETFGIARSGHKSTIFRY